MKKTLTLLACALFASAVIAQPASYPVKPIKIVVPFAAGGTSDTLARGIGQKLSESWGQSVIVDNRPGADGNVGADAVAKSAPDGYTLLLSDITTLTVSPLLVARLSYNPQKDFAPVTMVSYSAHALAVHPSVPAKTFSELVAYSKANRGKLNFAAGNPVTGLIAAHLKSVSGIDMLSVPYKGGSVALNALIAGEVDVTLVGLLAALPHIRGGRMRAVATTGSSRSSALPNVPTVAESGVPDFLSGSWQGLWAPVGTPAPVIAKLNAAVVSVLNDPAFKSRLAAQGTDVVGDSPEQFGAFLRKDADLWRKVAQAANIKPE
jgi:tripartite-type tricarboxylate transporter receptor subunit TctC